MYITYIYMCLISGCMYITYSYMCLISGCMYITGSYMCLISGCIYLLIMCSLFLLEMYMTLICINQSNVYFKQA